MAPLRWEQRDLTIRGRFGLAEELAVTGYTAEGCPLAITPAKNSPRVNPTRVRWTITHLESGITTGVFCRTVGAAKLAVEKLLAAGDWNRDAATIIADTALRDRCWDIVREFEASHV